MKRTIKRNGTIEMKMNFQEFSTLNSILFRIKVAKERSEIKKIGDFEGIETNIFITNEEFEQIRFIFNDMND